MRIVVAQWVELQELAHGEDQIVEEVLVAAAKMVKWTSKVTMPRKDMSGVCKRIRTGAEPAISTGRGSMKH